jgi:hypothetical protein
MLPRETYFIKDGVPTIYRNSGARLLYGLDLKNWLAAANTSLASVTADARGVEIDGDPFINGTWVCAWIVGFDATKGAINDCTFYFECTDGRTKDYRTIGFMKRPGDIA